MRALDVRAQRSALDVRRSGGERAAEREGPLSHPKPVAVGLDRGGGNPRRWPHAKYAGRATPKREWDAEARGAAPYFV